MFYRFTSDLEHASKIIEVREGPSKVLHVRLDEIPKSARAEEETRKGTPCDFQSRR